MTVIYVNKEFETEVGAVMLVKGCTWNEAIEIVKEELLEAQAEAQKRAMLFVEWAGRNFE